MAALRAAGIYFVLGGLWIAFSDRLLSLFYDQTEMITLLQTLKGGAYVTFTAILAYFLVRRYLLQILMMEQRLRQQQKLEALGTLAAGVAHEINNPITVIMSSAELIERRSRDDERINPLATNVLDATRHVTSIVNDLLHIARQEPDEPYSEVPAERLLEATSNLMDTVLRHDHILLHKHLDPDLPPISCRPRQLQQVLLNLLTNARDALNDRYPRAHPDKALSVTFCRSRQEQGDLLVISVEDRGAGIPPQVQSHMYDAFYTTKAAGQGTGLGLSISHSIVKEHGGTIECHSEPGHGTTFTLHLPLVQDTTSQAVNQQS